MMIKRGIKIVILLIAVITILYGGWHMYKRLEYNKQSFITDIYGYVPPQAIEVININKSYNVEKLYVYNSSSYELINILANQVYPPIIISKYAKGQNVLTMRAGKEQEELIKEYIAKNIAIPYPPRTTYYKDTEVLIYGLVNNKFLACAFYKGLFIMSYNYKLVENTIDIDPENSFFTDEDYKKIVEDVVKKYPISIFFKLQDDLLAMDYNSYNDTIAMEGYLLSKTQNDSITVTNKLIPYLANISDSTCIDSYEIHNKNNITAVKIILNKIY